MSFIIKQEAKGDFTPAPAGNHPAVCVGIVDIGMQFKEYSGKVTHEMIVLWELPYEINEADETLPVTISKFYTVSLYEMSNLYQDLTSWRGRAFTGDELAGFDLSNIINAACLLNVVHEPTQSGVIKAKVKGITPLPKGMEKPQHRTQKLICFNMEESSLEDYEALPSWLKKFVDKAQNKIAFDSRTMRPNQSGNFVTEESPMTEEMPF